MYIYVLMYCFDTFRPEKTTKYSLQASFFSTFHLHVLHSSTLLQSHVDLAACWGSASPPFLLILLFYDPPATLLALLTYHGPPATLLVFLTSHGSPATPLVFLIRRSSSTTTSTSYIFYFYRNTSPTYCN